MAFLFAAVEFSASFKNNKSTFCITGMNTIFLVYGLETLLFRNILLVKSPFRANYFCNRRLDSNRVIKFSINCFDTFVMTIMKNML